MDATYSAYVAAENHDVNNKINETLLIKRIKELISQSVVKYLVMN